MSERSRRDGVRIALEILLTIPRWNLKWQWLEENKNGQYIELAEAQKALIEFLQISKEQMPVDLMQVECQNIKDKLHLITYAIEDRFPGETRYETALRYVKERQAQINRSRDSFNSLATRVKELERGLENVLYGAEDDLSTGAKKYIKSVLNPIRNPIPKADLR